MAETRDLASHGYSAGHCGDALDCRALACFGRAAQSTLFRFHDAQRAGILARILLVLLLQRTYSAIPQSALSARLRHGAEMAVLASAFRMVLSVERVFCAGGEAPFSRRGSRCARAGT